MEDDPGLQSQLRWCFSDYEVLSAEDRPSALAELRRHEPPVVLQDLGLPPDAEGVSEGLAQYPRMPNEAGGLQTTHEQSLGSVAAPRCVVVSYADGPSR